MDPLYIGYGSQTGCSMELAERIRDRAVALGFPAEAGCLNQFEASGLAGRSWVVIVVAAASNGDAPDHPVTGCDKWIRFLKRRSQPGNLLAGMRYAILGLGNSTRAMGGNFWYEGHRGRGRVLHRTQSGGAVHSRGGAREWRWRRRPLHGPQRHRHPLHLLWIE